MAVITRFAFGAPVLVVSKNIPSPVRSRLGWELGIGMPALQPEALELMAEEEWDTLALKPLKKDRA